MFFKSDRVWKADASGFVNLEWTISDQWLLNAGFFGGQNSLTGGYFNPRLMFNYQLTPSQTLRFGWSTAQRAPTLFERFSDTRFFDANGNLVARTYFPSPDIRPETLTTHEVSYLGYFPNWGVELDVRVYDERFDRNIAVNRSIPNNQPRDFINFSGFQTQGIEYQFKWEVSESAQIIWNRNFNRFKWGASSNIFPPSQFGSLGWLQNFPDQWQFSLWVHYRAKMAWRDTLDRDTRVDLHLARDFRIGESRATAALTVQSLNGSRTEFSANPLRPSVFPRRAFATLHVEF